MKFLTLFQSLRNILSRLKKNKPSQKSSDTQRGWRHNEFVGICVGHSRAGDLGAYSVNWQFSEWEYNLAVSKELQVELKRRSIESKIYSVYKGETYRTAMAYVQNQLKEDGASLALELHFNSYDGSARGSETWYRQGALKSKRLACFLQDAVIKFYATKDRGVKPARRHNRGFRFLDNSHIPTALCEPFFGDNIEDLSLFSKPETLGKVLADGIESFLLNKHESNLSARKDNA